MKRNSQQRLVLEPLEDRRLLATCHVSRLGDFGAGGDLGGGHSRGDLRYCINKANDLPGPDTIDISATGTIQLTGALPLLSTDIDITGPGSAVLTVRRNTGGNYRIFDVGAGVTARISGLKVTNGFNPTDGQDGSGILNRGTLTLVDVHVIDNLGSSSFVTGGGINNTSTLVLQNSVVANNLVTCTVGSSFADAVGAGIYSSGSVTIQYSTITSNKAECLGPDYPSALGGGIYGGSLNISYSTVSGNTAHASGHSTFAAGGGIAGSNVTIAHSTISGNVVWASGDAEGYIAYGGGIAGGNLTITNCTLFDNEQYGEGGGGGIYTESATITHSTIAGNLVGILSTGTLTLRNSIVADNSGNDLKGAITSSGYNLIGKSAGGSGYVPSDLLDVDPLLGPLQDNGGSTLTMALHPGSLAIDSGTNQGAPEWDQRGPGFPRIVNGTIDRGAFEVQTTGAPGSLLDLALLITADLDADDGMRG
jgi:hypothetical protein